MAALLPWLAVAAVGAWLTLRLFAAERGQLRQRLEQEHQREVQTLLLDLKRRGLL